MILRRWFAVHRGSVGGVPGTITVMTVEMTPEQALLRVIHCLDRAHDKGFKAKAFARALDVVRSTPADEIADRARRDTLTDLDGIGSSTAAVITQALNGDEPTYLAKIEAESQVPITEAGQVYRDALKGDCHLHSTWSDGGAPIEAMAATAMALGHEYMVQTSTNPKGVEITDVADGSPAAKAGLQKGDVVTAIDGNDIGTAEALRSAVQAKQSGDEISVTYTRNGQSSTVKVTLTSRSQAQSS